MSSSLLGVLVQAFSTMWSEYSGLRSRIDRVAKYAIHIQEQQDPQVHQAVLLVKVGVMKLCANYYLGIVFYHPAP